MSGTRGAAWRTAALLAMGLPLAGCGRSPAFNVLGSYFPGWIACIVASVLLTALLRLACRRVGIERRIPVLPLFYTSLALLIASTLWLMAFE